MVVSERERPICAAYESTNQLQNSRLTKTANPKETSKNVTGAASEEMRY